MSLESRFAAIEKKLQAELEVIRADLKHAGNKGAAAETAFRSFLSQHLPRRYEIGQGEVIDTQSRSAGSLEPPGQIDVFVVSEEHPRFSDINNPALYVIEGILAGAEVKMQLNKSNLKDAIIKANKFKSLEPKMNKNDVVLSNPSDLKRFVDGRPYFLFSYESSVHLQDMLETVLNYETELGIPPTKHLDAIFCLDKGSLVNLGDGAGAFMMLTESKERMTGWGQSNKGVLLTLVSWLSIVVPRVHCYSSFLPKYLIKST